VVDDDDHHDEGCAMGGRTATDDPGPSSAILDRA